MGLQQKGWHKPISHCTSSMHKVKSTSEWQSRTTEPLNVSQTLPYGGALQGIQSLHPVKCQWLWPIITHFQATYDTYMSCFSSQCFLLMFWCMNCVVGHTLVNFCCSRGHYDSTWTFQESFQVAVETGLTWTSCSESWLGLSWQPCVNARPSHCGRFAQHPQRMMPWTHEIVYAQPQRMVAGVNYNIQNWKFGMFSRGRLVNH